MSAPPRTAEEFDSYVGQVARASRITGLLAGAGLLLVLVSLVVAASRLAESRRTLAEVRGQVDAKYAELEGVQRELRVASDSLARLREGFAAFTAVVNRQDPALGREAAVAARDSARSARVVYIQFRGELPRTMINEMRARLTQAGVNAPGAERIAREFGNSVRFFHPQDAAAARQLAREASAFFAQRGCATEFPVQDLTARGRAVPLGQLEIWIAVDCRTPASAG